MARLMRGCSVGWDASSTLNNSSYKFFPRPQARVGNRDIFAGGLTRQDNQFLRQVHNFDGTTHIEHKDITALPHISGLQDQLDRFRDGHEEALDLLVGDGQGPSPGQLLF